MLRDLITLARDAGEEAYVTGGERIEAQHATTVIEQLGISYLRGLGPKQIAILRKLEKNRAFDVTAPANMQLLVSRRVLEYSSTEFRVHPALLPLLPPEGAQDG